MKAAIYRGIGRIGLQEVERLPPPPGYVTIDTRQTGICGSDLHVYRGHWPQPATLALGHETSGVVVELGEEVSGVEPGDRVAIECFSHCGRCRYCRGGHYNHCLERQWVSQDTHGGFSEFTTAHASALFRLPPGLSFEEGALVEPLAVGCRAVGQAGATWRDRVAILGGGTIGQCCLAAAKAANVRETWITVKYPQQARLARDLGADHVFVLGGSDLDDWVSDLARGPRPDAVIETVGGGGNFDLALQIVRPRGVVVLLAGYPETGGGGPGTGSGIRGGGNRIPLLRLDRIGHRLRSGHRPDGHRPGGRDPPRHPPVPSGSGRGSLPRRSRQVLRVHQGPPLPVIQSRPAVLGKVECRLLPERISTVTSPGRRTAWKLIAENPQNADGVGWNSTPLCSVEKPK